MLLGNIADSEGFNYRGERLLQCFPVLGKHLFNRTQFYAMSHLATEISQYLTIVVVDMSITYVTPLLLNQPLSCCS